MRDKGFLDTDKGGMVSETSKEKQRKHRPGIRGRVSRLEGQSYDVPHAKAPKINSSPSHEPKEERSHGK